jgi:hypothetical protein
MSKKTTELAPLTPPDLKQCQAEYSNGVNFMTFGGRRQMIRCTKKPKWIATEIEPGEDGRRGAMSICVNCRPHMEKKMPRAISFTKIGPNDHLIQHIDKKLMGEDSGNKGQTT